MLEILKKVEKLDLGHALNHIQNTAEKVLSKRRWYQYLVASSKDAQECDGMDYLLINGQYFDWKEFGWNKNAIVMAFLEYFTNDEIKQIAVAL